MTELYLLKYKLIFIKIHNFKLKNIKLTFLLNKLKKNILYTFIFMTLKDQLQINDNCYYLYYYFISYSSYYAKLNKSVSQLESRFYDSESA